METLKLLRDYFATAVFTGKCLVFISEDWRVELTEHKDSDFSRGAKQAPVIRVRIFKKAVNGEFVPGFQAPAAGTLHVNRHTSTSWIPVGFFPPADPPRTVHRTSGTRER